MSGGRIVAVVAVGIVLTVTVLVGNGVFAAQATVLNDEFVTNAVESEDGYAELTREMERTIGAGASNATAGGAGGSFAAVLDGDPLEDAITPSYVKSQVEPNVQALFAYLHGDSPRLNLTVDTRPLAENVGTEVAASVRNTTVSELLAAAPGDPFAEAPIEPPFVRELTENAESYRSAKASLRADLREKILDAAVQTAFTEYGNDDLLALVVADYDPDEYSEREKERMVQDRESEIRSALRDRIEATKGDRIDARLQDRLDQFRENVTAQRIDADAVGSEAIAAAARDLRDAVVTAATTDQSYGAYHANVTAARGEVGDAVGEYTTQRFTDEVGVVDLNERLGIARQGEFELPRTAIGYLDIAGIALPIVGLLLVGGLWLVTRSVVTTATVVGASLVVGTLPAIVGAPIAGDRLRSMIEPEGEAATSLEPVVDGIVGRVVGVVTSQSLTIAAVGVLLLAVAVALRYGLDDRLRAALDDRWDVGGNR